MGVTPLFGSIVVFGCAGSFHGTLSQGPYTGPQPAKGQPVVTGVSPASVTAGGPGFTLTVTGTHFAAGDTVEWNSYFPLQSVFVSSTRMTAQVPAGLLGVPGSAGIIVQTPVPYSLTYGTNVTITAAPPPGTAGFTLSTIGVQANDMVWDPASRNIYLSVAETDPLQANTITALDPVTGQFGVSVSAKPGANRLGVSSDGAWLFAGIDQNASVQRFALPGLAGNVTIPLDSDPSGKPYMALDLEPSPGSPNTIAVARATSSSINTTGSNVAIYDGANERASIASNFPINVPIGSLAWNTSGSELYASYNDSDLDNLFILSVNSAGAQIARNEQLMPGAEAFDMGSIHYSALTGEIFTEGGTVIDPSEGTVVAHIPTGAFNGGIAYPPGSLLILDDNLGMIWMLAEIPGSPRQQFTIEAFDLRTDVLLGSIAIPNVVGTPVRFIRWGSNGLAFLTRGTDGPQQGDGVYIVSGVFVTTPSVQVRRPPVS